MIIDRKIKLKNDSLITSYAPNGLQFSDGSVLEADTVIFATGFGEYRDSLKYLFTEEQHKSIKPAWGLDWEGELQGCYRDMGLPRLWCMMGKLSNSSLSSVSGSRLVWRSSYPTSRLLPSFPLRASTDTPNEIIS
jgi:hypothetical protein